MEKLEAYSVGDNKLYAVMDLPCYLVQGDRRVLYKAIMNELKAPSTQNDRTILLMGFKGAFDLPGHACDILFEEGDNLLAGWTAQKEAHLFYTGDLTFIKHRVNNLAYFAKSRKDREYHRTLAARLGQFGAKPW